MRGTDYIGEESKLPVTPIKVTASQYVSTNELYLFKNGKFVFLSGHLITSSDCPVFATLFTLPDGYKPVNPFSLKPFNSYQTEWFFVNYAGEVANQIGTVTAGIRYFTAEYMVG